MHNIESKKTDSFAQNIRRVRRALLSVSDKTGIIDFAKELCALGIELLSTGGTAKLLQDHQVPVIDIADYTGSPEMLGGRVKTLHPKIHGGILARRGVDDSELKQYDIQPIDLVVANLYPFSKTIEAPNCDLASAIENIDIGGVTLLRAAAKNYADVTVVVQYRDYAKVLRELAQEGGIQAQTRFRLAKKAFAHTAHYDGAITNYLTSFDDEGKQLPFPGVYNVQFRKKRTLRYGENPHQRAAFYADTHVKLDSTLAKAHKLQGKTSSFNNIADADAALECVKAFLGTPACAIVKHANPCGVALGETQLEAYERAYATDPQAAFGGIIAFNEPLQAGTTEAILNQQYVEVIIAPDVDPIAEKILMTKPSIRVIVCGELSKKPTPGFDLKRIHGGLLVQDWDELDINLNTLEFVTQRKPSEKELQDLIFAWRVAQCVKSNAIVYARNQRTLGIGAGQMSRVYSARLAAMKARDENLELDNAVMASDAFFPFRDGIDAAAKEGIRAIIQPGGSIRDAEIIDAANEQNIAMVFTRIRHFKH